MRTTRFIMLAVLLTCVLGVQGAWAETAGYIDSGQNFEFYLGVVGARYTGVYNPGTDGGYGAAIAGEATATDNTGDNYGGYFTNRGYGAAVLGSASRTSGPALGGSFESKSTTGTGVRGDAYATSGYNHGGYFKSNSTSGKGVWGYASAYSGYTYGGYFTSNSTSGIGVYGIVPATSGYTYGGSFESKSTSGKGVQGSASATSGTTYGGFFTNNSTSGRGVYGWAQATSGTTYGGSFRSNSTSGKGVQGWASATSGATKGGSFQTDSTTGKGVEGIATKTTGVNYGVYGQTSSPSGYGVYSKGNMKVEGKFTVTGTKSAVVKLEDGKGVTLYAVEASENWFEDFGSAKLKEGKAVVEIDPTFAKTINTNLEYHVFLTPRGESNWLYVTNQKGASFEVREGNGGKSDISFSYRIVAKRKGYEDQRLVQVNDDQTPTMATTELENPQEQNAMEMAAQMK